MSDGWGGPTWAQWHDTARDIEATVAEAKASHENARQWKAYAERLKQELDEVWALYCETKGNVAGQRRLKDIAIEELSKADPTNAFLDPANRKQPFEEAKEAAMKEVRRNA